MFMADGRNFFLTFWDVPSRDAVYAKVLGKAQIQIMISQSISGIAGSQAGQSVLPNGLFGGSPLSELSQKWVSREISNFSYLIQLNTLAGRSYNDLTQYPTFPWVLADYDSENLDLEDEKTYRNFQMPMGGQGKSRANQFSERYEAWDDPSLPACHYGTHYSSSMIVCSYMIRMQPFTEQYLKIQGGHFDHPDRLFHSIPQSWKSASQLNTTDVRELIPEFFYLPQMFLNENKFNFGKKQTGEVIDNVLLPRWAKGDPRLFIKLHREALESEYVSANLHHWIDLIFGYKQQGDAAAQALNVFHYLSYEGAVDLDKITDPVEKQSTISIIHNFGQTPKQLFKKPHQKRSQIQKDQFRIEEHFRLLKQTCRPLYEKPDRRVSDVKFLNGKLIIAGPDRILVPDNFSKYLEWGHLDDSLRIYNYDSDRCVSVFENLHIGRISAAVFADHEVLVTGGEDTTICIWNFINGKRPQVDLDACLRGHKKNINCLAASKSYSIVVSGADDSTAIIWDLNRHEFVRCLVGHKNPLTKVFINNKTGDIVTLDETELFLWDVNGNLVLNHVVSEADGSTDPVHSLAFLENEIDTEYIFTGHKSSSINYWRKIFKEGEGFVLSNIFKLDGKSTSPVSYLKVSTNNRYLISGNHSGKLICWNLPDGGGTDMHYAAGDSCMDCQQKFSVLDRRSNCKYCGGVFCSTCLIHTDDKLRLCSSCNNFLISYRKSPQ